MIFKEILSLDLTEEVQELVIGLVEEEGEEIKDLRISSSTNPDFNQIQK
jgi:uncharacterized protein YciU (UPF0263 family)